MIDMILADLTAIFIAAAVILLMLIWLCRPGQGRKR